MCNCVTPRRARVQGQVVDRFQFDVPHLGLSYDGYVPSDLGIGSGDYVSFTYCLTCGQIEKFQPKSDQQVLETILSEKAGALPEIDDEDVMAGLLAEGRRVGVVQP